MRTIRDEIITVKAGQYVRVTYKTDWTSKLNAKSKKLGYRVEKITETTVRTGVDYNHMAAVIERKTLDTNENRNYTNPYEWVVNNRIKRKIDTGEEYCVLGTTKNANSKSKYIIYNGINDVRIVDCIGTDEMELFVPSALKNPSIPDVITVKLANIKRFNKVVA